jgi:hypothetical protein
MSVFPLVVSPQFFEPQKFLASGRRGLAAAANPDFDAQGTASAVIFRTYFRRSHRGWCPNLKTSALVIMRLASSSNIFSKVTVAL